MIVPRAILSISLLLLVSCSGSCVPSGIEGTFELTTSGTEYSLHLSPGGRGTLSSGSRAIGTLRWELVKGPQDQLLEMAASGEVFESLQQLSAAANNRRRESIGNGGVFESVPKCNRKGVLQRLVIRYDDGTSFARTRKGS
jgi:hypothetical protein